MEFIQTNLVAILILLLAISEFLALLPGFKSNSIFQLIVNIIKGFLPDGTTKK